MPIKVILNVTEGPGEGKNFEFTSGEVIIGRSKGELQLPDKKISSQHCRITIEGNNCYIEDMGSTNGTFLSGKKVTGKATIQNLDEITIGLSRINAAVVEQLQQFKKANKRASDEEQNEFEVSGAQPKKKKGKIHPPDTTLPPVDAEYRESGVNRIDAMIQDEMATFSSYDHPRASNTKSTQVSLPKIQIRLQKKKGPEGLSQFICTKNVSTMGRKNVDIKLNDLDCSRLHAQVEIVGGSKAYAKDLGSTNGTFVNGKRISMQELNNGDLLQIGQTIFEVRIESGEE